MAAFVAEYLHHQVRGAIHDLRPLGETRHRIDEPTKPRHAHHLVEITKRGFELRKEVDRACARRLLSVLNGYAAPQLAFCHQLAVEAETNLAGNDKDVAGTREGHIVGDWACRGRQGNAE